MNRTEYVERLMKIGILECCAERTVDAFLERDEYAALRNGGRFSFALIVNKNLQINVDIPFNLWYHIITARR